MGVYVDGLGSLDRVWSIDINGCRRNALLHAKRLPSFDFTDEPEKRFDDYDFFWVDNGVDIGYEACDCMYIPSKVSRGDCMECHGTGLSPQVGLSAS